MEKSRAVLLTLPLALVAILASTAFGATIRVDCAGGGDYTAIMAGIAASSNGDTVEVAECTYVENVYFLGKSINLVSESGPGGTIIDGNGFGSVVYFGSGEGLDSILDGFTIRNGSASSGGGIYCADASPTIRNNVIEGNAAGYGGGGLFCLRSSPRVENNIFSMNEASLGGGIGCDESSAPEVTGCTIDGNTGLIGGGLYCGNGSAPSVTVNAISNNSATQGGGVYCDLSDPTLQGNNIAGNTADYGAGIEILDASPQITGNAIIGNIAAVTGGGINCDQDTGVTSPEIASNLIQGNDAVNGGGISGFGASPTIMRNTISGNSAGTGGGIRDISNESLIQGNVILDNTASIGAGLYVASSLTTLVNNNIIGNIATGTGGGIACSEASPEITHNTITDNAADIGGGIICLNASPTIANSIVWGNSAVTVGTEIYLFEASDPVVSYSDIDGEWTGDGNFYLDPLFAGGGDYHLTAGSPCIDTGTDAGVLDDIDVDVRPQISGYDVGSDEFAGACWDFDGDGFLEAQCGGGDCDDSDPDVNPDEPEGPLLNCDGIDNDCDGEIDELCTVFTLDLDADYAAGRLELDFTLATPIAVTWSNFVIIQSAPFFIKLWSISLPAIAAPTSMPISFAFPGLGVIGIFSDFTTAGGIQAVALEFVDAT